MNELENKILKLQNKLANLKMLLVKERIYSIAMNRDEQYDKKIYPDICDTDIKDEENWSVTYIYLPGLTRSDNVIVDDAIDDASGAVEVSFGRIYGEYYIRTNDNDNNFNIYRSSMEGTIRIVINEFIEVGRHNQAKMLDRYSKNNNIPEWFALKIFMYFSYNKWSDNNIYSYLSEIKL